MEPQCTQCHRLIIGATHPGLCMDCRMMAYGQAQVNYDAMRIAQGMAQGIPLENLIGQGTVASSPYDAMNRWRERAERAEAELQRLRTQVANLEIRLNTMRRLTQAATERNHGTISQERLIALIRLCHPDLHKGSDLANETTKWLLSLRKGN